MYTYILQRNAVDFTKILERAKKARHEHIITFEDMREAIRAEFQVGRLSEMLDGNHSYMFVCTCMY